MLFRLIVLSGPLKGRRLTVDRAPMTIGRDPQCAIHLDDEEVAQRHAQIEHTEAGLIVRDLGTMNRVLVNKREVREAHLRHGDEIEIGRTRLLVQALLQTEVEGREADESKSRRWLGTTPRTVVLWLVLLVLAAWYAWKPAPRAPAPPPKPIHPVRREPPPPQPGSPVLPEMVEELRDMRDTLATIKETIAEIGARPPPPEPSIPETETKPPPDFRGWLTVEDVEQVKLPLENSPDEARLLRLRLRAAPGVRIDPSKVRMEVQLFNRESATQRIYPARVQVQVSAPEFGEGPLTGGGSAIATIQCRVPGAAGYVGRYYGFRLKVFYMEVLQAEVDRPRTLAADLWKETDGVPR